MPVPEGFTKADFKGKNADPIRDLRIKDFISYFLATNIPDHEGIFIIKKQFGVDLAVTTYRNLKAEVMSQPEVTMWLNSFAKIGFVSEHIKDIERVKMMGDRLEAKFLLEISKEEEEIDYDKLDKIIKNFMALTKLGVVLRAGAPVLARLKAQLDAANVRAVQNAPNISTEEKTKIIGKSGPKTYDAITVPNTLEGQSDDQVTVVTRYKPNKNIDVEEVAKPVKIDHNGRVVKSSEENNSSSFSEDQQQQQDISTNRTDGGNSEFIRFLMEESEPQQLIPKRLKSGLNLTTL
jgi:hypothetical protein